MTFAGGGLSDEEANSWEDELSESEESGDNYYDEEDEYEEASPSPKKGKITKEASSSQLDCDKASEADDDDEIDSDAGRLVINVHCTDYEVIKKVARKGLGFKLK